MKKTIAALALLLAALIAAPVASADDGARSQPDTVTWQDDTGLEHHARALTADEVKARGLDKYVDMSRYSASRPELATEQASGERVAPRQAGAQSKQAAADTCWSHWYSHGTNLLYGRTDVSWCGDGQWVRYATNRCWGYANPAVPTYRYLRCQTDPQFGVGWNVYEVWSRWELCPGWQPLTGQCWVHDDPVQEWQYQGDGGVVKIG